MRGRSITSKRCTDAEVNWRLQWSRSACNLGKFQPPTETVVPLVSQRYKDTLIYLVLLVITTYSVPLFHSLTRLSS